MMGLEGNPLMLFLENQTINSSKYCSHWAQLKAATVDDKHLELVSGKGISSIRITQDPVFLWWPGKNCYSLIGNFWFIHRIHQTLHFLKSIYFGIYKILLIEKISFLLLWFSCSVVSDSLQPHGCSTPGFPVLHHLLELAQTQDVTLKDELPRLVGAQYATGEGWRNSSRRNERTELKQKQRPAVDVSGGESKVQGCK